MRVDREVEIGVLVDDHAGVAAELEHDLLHAGAPLHVPADVGRAGEAQQLEAIVGRPARRRLRGSSA